MLTAIAFLSFIACGIFLHITAVRLYYKGYAIGASSNGSADQITGLYLLNLLADSPAKDIREMILALGSQALITIMAAEFSNDDKTYIILWATAIIGLLYVMIGIELFSEGVEKGSTKKPQAS